MSVEVERIVPYAGNDEDKGTQVRRMFNRIAGRYDLLNGMLSLGFDRGWRRKTVDSLRAIAPAPGARHRRGHGRHGAAALSAPLAVGPCRSGRPV